MTTLFTIGDLLPKSPVVCIIQWDLQLKCFKRWCEQQLTEANWIACMKHCKLLLEKFSQFASDFIFFTDEKMFTVALLTKRQNDHVYTPSDTRKSSITDERLLRCRPTFSKSLVVSVGVCKLGCTELVFVEPGVTVDGRWNHLHVPSAQHTAHRTRDTV